MTFYPDDAPVPSALRNDEFVLRPLRAADVDLDYEAVMASQETLRRGSGGQWPRPAPRADLFHVTSKAIETL